MSAFHFIPNHCSLHLLVRKVPAWIKKKRSHNWFISLKITRWFFFPPTRTVVFKALLEKKKVFFKKLLFLLIHSLVSVKQASNSKSYLVFYFVIPSILEHCLISVTGLSVFIGRSFQSGGFFRILDVGNSSSLMELFSFPFFIHGESGRNRQI